MTADRYTKALLTVIALALVAIAGHLWMGQLRPRDAHAQTVAPKPFVWTKTADEILASVARFCHRISGTGH